MFKSVAPLDIAVVGWHSHNEMFDAIAADLRAAGHRIVRFADRNAIAAASGPLAGVDILLCVAVFPVTRAMICCRSASSAQPGDETSRCWGRAQTERRVWGSRGTNRPWRSAR